MSDVQSFDPHAIQLTERAISRVRSLIELENNADLKLRVFVTGGGCAGFQYGFTLDEIVAEDDTVVDFNGVQALVDALSFQYLAGSEVDFQEGLEGARFLINNPNAETTCGCGASFSA